MAHWEKASCQAWKLKFDINDPQDGKGKPTYTVVL